MKRLIPLGFALTTAFAVLAMPRPVLWLSAERTGDFTPGELAPAVVDGAFNGLPAFVITNGAHLTAKTETTNRTVVAVVRPDQKQRYNPGLFGRRGSIARSIRGWGKWGDANWDAGKESLFFGGRAWVDGEKRYDPSAGLARAHVAFESCGAHVLAAVATNDVVYVPTVGANRDIPTDRSYWSGALAELFVFDRALEESDIVTLSDRLMDKWRISPSVEPVAFKVFFRNQANAALRGSIRSSVPHEYAVSGTVAGRALGEMRVKAGKEETCFALPFEPTLETGRHPYSLKVVKCADGRTVHEERGEIEMRAPLDKSAWRVFDWGGHKQPSVEFMKRVGITVANVRADGPDNVKRRRRQIAQAAELVKAGFLLDIRHENAPVWKRLGYDDAAIAAEVRRDLAPFEGLDPWVMTLLNTETYGLKVFSSATNEPCFLAAARAALGNRVDFRFQAHPLQLPFEDKAAVKAGLKGLRGAVKRGDPALETLAWFVGRGIPAYRVTTASAAAAKAANPGGVVWTEPLAGPGQAEGVDMLADWIYTYGAKNRLALQRQMYGKVRALGRPMPFMPTISPTIFYSGLNVDGTGELEPSQADKSHPVTDFRELALYSWVALGASRADALSIWNLGAWLDEKTEAGAPERYGEFMRGKFTPVAEKLKGLENVRAPLAVLQPLLPSVAAGGARFSAWHCLRQQLLLLAQSTGVPFDVLFDAEIDAETLKRYKVVYLPWSYCLYEDQVAALAKASAAGTKVVTDAPGEWLSKHCRAFECLKDVAYRHPKDIRSVLPLAAWARRTGETLRGELFAWSDRDDEPEGSFTFVKEKGARRFVLVVNGAASDLAITTHFRGGKTVTETYAPAEARLFEF